MYAERGIEMAEAKAVIIGGVEFPIAAGGYTVSRNKIWSTNTGRNNAGNMVGTIIAIKTKVEVELVPITPAQAKAIDNVVSDINNPFPTADILYLDGTRKTLTVYLSDNIPYKWKSRALGENGAGLITGVKLSLIEK